MTDKTLILVCNAHLDPVWLWEWEEGLAETLSTFRIAAKFCREYEGFVFCHNEALLYQYVEEYEPELFEEIRALVRGGNWKVIGGWYLQPDCNMPSGEALIRQIVVGKNYFMDRFGVEPETAVNFDPFGHSRGLVQIMKKSGYSSYLFCRPDHHFLNLPDLDFKWVGYDGSEILAHRPFDHYNSAKGAAANKIKKWLGQNSNRKNGILLWGIGNHGGGPSREDLEQICGLQKQTTGRKIRHGTPDEYFTMIREEKRDLPNVETSINPFAVGCYTSMQRIKKKYRQLENLYSLTEKMCTLTHLQGIMEYPGKLLSEALEDLLFCQFHDILPGSSIQEVEEYAIQRLHHGMEILGRLRSQAFMANLSGQPEAKEDEFPLLFYNPHPFDVDGTMVIEVQAQEPNPDEHYLQVPEVMDPYGNLIPSQVEKESSNIVQDHRKRVVFNTRLEASSMNRFSCFLKKIQLPSPGPDKAPARFRFNLQKGHLEINPATGLIQSYEIDGKQILLPGSGRLLVIKDNADPWGMTVRSFRQVKGEFQLLPPQLAARFAGVDATRLSPVRIIEEGPIRIVVEGLFSFGDSYAAIRYKIPLKGNEIEVEPRIYWMEKDSMLKISFRSGWDDAKCFGQVAYGVEKFDRPGEELVAQKWIGMESPAEKMALTVINDTNYGFDYDNGELRISMLRSPAYSGHPGRKDQPIAPQDRFEPRIDQGEQSFRFWIQAGNHAERKESVHRESLIRNESLPALCCYPSGKGEKLLPGVILSDPTIQLSALKMSEKKNRLVMRLFEPAGKNRTVEITIPVLDFSCTIALKPFEIKTIAIDPGARTMVETDLLERERPHHNGQ
jgi:alpha-mannosidase